MFHKSNNNIFISLKNVEKHLLTTTMTKEKRFNLTHNSKFNIRRKRPLNVNLVTLTSDKITNFSFFGGITRKKKTRSLNCSIRLSTILSGKRVHITVGYNSNSSNFSSENKMY